MRRSKRPSQRSSAPRHTGRCKPSTPAAAIRDHRCAIGARSGDRDRISAELSDGKAGVGVLARNEEADGIESMLTEPGGVSETHLVDDEALEAVTAAATPA